jgi:RNA polymerase sigma-70 factor (ECF subfamily)
MFGRSSEKSRRVEARVDRRDSFEDLILPHLNAAYNLARWLTRNEQDAEDVVQEAYLRAYSSFDTFQPERDGRGWMLRIVQNTCYTWLRKNRPNELRTGMDDFGHEALSPLPDPEVELLRRTSSDVMRKAIEELPIEFREVIILRELEELSYSEIARILDIPKGTVMSRLSRGRAELQRKVSRTAIGKTV